MEVSVHRETFTCHVGLCYLSIKTWDQGCVLVTQSCPTLCDPMEPRQAPLSMEFSRREYRSAEPFPSPGNLFNPGRLPCRQILHHLNCQGSQAARSSTRTAGQKARSGPSVLLIWQTFSNYRLNGEWTDASRPSINTPATPHPLSIQMAAEAWKCFPTASKGSQRAFHTPYGFMIPVHEDLGSREGHQMAGRQKNPGLHGM